MSQQIKWNTWLLDLDFSSESAQNSSAHRAPFPHRGFVFHSLSTLLVPLTSLQISMNTDKESLPLLQDSNFAPKIYLLCLCVLALWLWPTLLWGQTKGSVKAWGSGKPPMMNVAPKVTRLPQPKGILFAPISPNSSKPTTFLRVPGLKLAKQIVIKNKDKSWAGKVRGYFGKGRAKVALLETDKVVYRPGDTLWGRSREVWLRGNRVSKGEQRVLIRLSDAMGRVKQQQVLKVKQGRTTFSLFLPQNLMSGVYSLRYFNLFSKATQQISLVVKSGYRAYPRLILKWSKPSFFPGEQVQALVRLKSRKGRMSRSLLRLTLRRGKRVLKTWTVRVRARQRAWIHFKLPRKARQQQSLTIRARWKRRTLRRRFIIPTTASKLRVQFFPEGGQSLEDYPSRVYVSSNLSDSGQPVNVEGVIETSKGKLVASFRSLMNGLGRFRYIPKEDMSYRLRVLKPLQYAGVYTLPSANDEGVAVEAVDDFASNSSVLGLKVHSSKKRNVSVAVLFRERLIAHRQFEVQEGSQLLKVPLQPHLRGILRVTLFDSSYKTPLAERLVFRHASKGLKIQVQSLQPNVTFRRKVRVGVKVTDGKGNPVPNAIVGLTVTRRWKRFSVHRAPNWLAQRYLNHRELRGPIAHPNSYFESNEPKTLRGLDLVMGVHGWRTWNWDVLKKSKELEIQTVGSLRLEATKNKKWKALEIPTGKAWSQLFSSWISFFDEGFFRSLKAFAKNSKRKRSKDSDGDGIPDAADQCPITPGSVLAQGCRLPDHDRDGWPNSLDSCPYVSGHSALRGCPAQKVVSPKKSQIKVSANLYFAEGENSINKETFVVLQSTLKLMKLYPGLSLVLEGHTSTLEGKGEKAKALGLLRAKTIQRWLSKKGVESSRLQVKSYGERRPITMMPSKVMQAKNQRVMIVVASYLPMPWWFEVSKARSFPVRSYATQWKGQTTDWRSTLYWNPTLRTNDEGVAFATFSTGDVQAVYDVRATAMGKGRLGVGEHSFQTVKPFQVRFLAPKGVVFTDAINFPVVLYNRSSRKLRVSWDVSLGSSLKFEGDRPKPTLLLAPWSRMALYLPLRVVASSGKATVRFSAVTRQKGWSDVVSATFPVAPRGFPRNKAIANVLQPSQVTLVKPELSSKWRTNFVKARWVLFPSLLSQFGWSAQQRQSWVKGSMESLMARSFPHIFRLGSWSHYPKQKPSKMMESHRVLQSVLLGWSKRQTKDGSMSWYPGHRSSKLATATGVLLALAMKNVIRVPKSGLNRAVAWLWKRRNSRGVWGLERGQSLLTPALRTVRVAYLTYVLAEAGKTRLKPQLKWLKGRVDKLRDPYVWSLTLMAWIKVYGPQHPQVTYWSRLLFQNRRSDGGFYGSLPSIDGAQGRSLHIQATAYALKALVRANMPPVVLLPTLRWLHQQRTASGLGSERAAALALQALYAFHQKTRLEESGGQVSLSLKKKVVAKGTYSKEQGQALVLQGWSHALGSGVKSLQMALRSRHRVPYLMSWKFTTLQSNSHPRAPLVLDVGLSSVKWQKGLLVPLKITVFQRAKDTITVPVVKLFLPAGLLAKEWRLQALVTMKKLTWFRVRGTEVTLVFPPLSNKQTLSLTVLCEARIPGYFTSQPSYVFPSNNPGFRTWSSPLQLNVRP